MAQRTRREILEDVAAGRLDPQEAADLLDTAAPDAAGTASGGDDAAGESSPPSVPSIKRIQVRAAHRRVRLIGDPAVATYAVEGPHHVRRDGASLLITGESEPLETDNAWTLLSGGMFREVADRIQQGFAQNTSLTVRIRPDLAVGVEVTAGSVQSEGLRALDHVRVTGGSVRVRDVLEPLDLLVQAGSAQVSTRQSHGRSRLRCESGSLNLTLLDGTDARVRHEVQLGRLVTKPERQSKDSEFTIGNGAAQIDIEVMMGSATVVTDS
jgi:hypothetical protein